jgi:cell wall-associated NlpC family hydrolase
MAGRIRAGGIAAALLAAALIAGSSTAAFADAPAASPAPSATSTPSDPAAQRALHDLAIRIVALQRKAEQLGEAAQKAGEKSNDAKAASDAAEEQLTEARAAAAAAAEKARESRARASALAAQLARTNMGTLPLDLLLNGQSAEGVLGGLSTTGQLSVQARLLFDAAKADQLEAERLQGVATSRASDAAEASAKAAKAYAAAKKEAASAKKAVTAALDEQRRLLASDHDGTAVCGDVGSAPVSACLPGAGTAPKGKSVGAKVIRFAQAQIGKPYVFAAAGPNAYDCSGLTLAAYASAGVSIGIHSATAQYNLAAGQGDLVPLTDAKPGDLLFYTDGGGDMYHVTIYAGDGMMLEAPYPGSTVREAPIRAGDLVQQAAHFG